MIKGNIKFTSHQTEAKKEQAEHKKLVQELKRRKANGEDGLVIRNGKITEWLPFRPNPQNFWG